MTNEPADESRWLLEPPGPGEVLFQIAVGEGIEVSEEARQAIDSLLKGLLADDTQGFAAGCWPRCPDLNSCGAFECKGLHNCKPLWQKPCVAEMTCTITKIR